MISNKTRRFTPTGEQTYHPAPNAALLIDFDNVTMGIRSDLGKELKTLLNSDIIKGKVAVQRAYADWRRYPSYIVPLAESSVDLIYAPAYGSSKKNATDLRMAVDAIELVFTRPEIGTFILLTGDSDFSSCVLKLKEYGKYVIGVGMRESSSDLLIQNCDEYYSYHSLSGLTRAGEVEESTEDPWVLLRKAAEHMAANRDVMRTDRLKQVMLEMDPAFDEKKIGYSKFSRFVMEGANKGLLRLKKGENGQYEIVMADREETAAAPPREERRRDRDRDRGRRTREAEPRQPAPAPAPEPAVIEAEAKPEPEQPQAEPEKIAAAVETAPVGEEKKETAVTVEQPNQLQTAYQLLQEAVRRLVSNGKGARDADVKRKMLELAPSFDESELGFGKFTRFLRQAHDAEVIDLTRVNGGNYDVFLPEGGRRLPAPPTAEVSAPKAAEAAAPVETAEAPAVAAEKEEKPAAEPKREKPTGRGVRGRRGRAAEAEGPPPLLPGQVVSGAKIEKAAQEAAPASKEEPIAAVTAEPEPETKAEAPAEEAAPKAATPRARRGRSRGAVEGVPTILPGQTVAVPKPESPAAAPEAEVEEEAAAEEKAPRKRTRSRSRSRKKTEEAPAPETQEIAAGFSAADLGLPRDRDSIQAYLANSYKGVGKKTAETLLDAFGDDVFQAFEEQPDRVREVLGDKRASGVLEQWEADLGRRRESAGEPQAEEAPAAAEESEESKSRSRSRSRRGGRGRSRKKKEPSPS